MIEQGRPTENPGHFPFIFVKKFPSRNNLFSPVVLVFYFYRYTRLFTNYTLRIIVK